MGRTSERTSRSTAGFTLLEIMIVVAIVGVLAAIASASYDRYREKLRVNQAIIDIGAMSVALKLYEYDAREFPPTLAEIGWGNRLDPWGRPYQYYDLAAKRGNGKARKDKKLAPLNSDFDLYSVGKDGASKAPLVTPVSRDDVVRARDGKFIGLAKDFDP